MSIERCRYADICGDFTPCAACEPDGTPPCRTACTTKDHRTYGECLRAANLTIDRDALAQGRQR